MPDLGNLDNLDSAQWEQVHQLANEFEEARRKNPLTTLDPYLEKADEKLRPFLLVELIKSDLDISWAANERVYLEDYLTRYEDVVPAASVPAHLILEEYHLRVNQGDIPHGDVSSYQNRFPNQFEELAQLITKEKESEPLDQGTTEPAGTDTPSPANPPPSAENDGTLIGRSQRIPKPDQPSESPRVEVYEPPKTNERPESSEGTLRTGGGTDEPNQKIEPNEAGQSVGGYTLVEKLTQTEIVEVWKAKSPTQQPVALQLVRYASGAEGRLDESPAFKKAEQLNHPNLLPWHHHFESDDKLVVVSDLPDGTLANRLKECQRQGHKAIPPEELLNYIRDLANILGYLKTEGLSPWEVRPENVLLMRGQAYILHLGLPEFHGTKVLQSDTFQFSPYTSPELCEGQLHRNSDQYCLAIMYVELRRGKLPFRHPSLDGLVPDHLQEDPSLVSLTAPEAQVVLRAGSPSPDRRFANCKAFSDALHRVLITENKPSGEVTCVKREFIGKGTFGDVWRAETPGGIEVALKVINLDDPEKGKLGLGALDLTKHLSHPYLIQVFAYWVQGKELSIVMELADKSLHDRLKECLKDGIPGIPKKELLRYIEQISEALDYLHQNNVIHCDIKPANLLLKNTFAKIADFDVATFVRSQFAFERTTSGTMPYMPPEVWYGKLSKHSDQYSLAASYVELRLGRRLFETKSLVGAKEAHCNQEPDLSPLSGREQAVLRKALAKEPEERHASCEAFAQALRQAVLGSPDSSANFRLEDYVSVRSEDVEPIPQQEEPSKPTPPRKPRSKRLIPALVLLVTLGLLGVVLWLMSAPPRINVSIKTTPPGATVFVDNKKQPTTTPGTFELSQGKHTVRLELKGRPPIEKEIVVAASGTNFRFEFRPAPDKKIEPPLQVRIASTPPGATIFLDGKKQTQRTPATLPLSRGTHTLRLQLGTRTPIQKDVFVGNFNRKFDFTFPELGQLLRIASEPSGADIFIDGKPRGVTPQDLRLQEGEYKIALKMKGRETFQRVVRIEPDKAPASINPTLALLPAQHYAFLVGVRQSGPVNGAKLPAFLHAETDIEELYRTLLARKYKPENITILTGSRANGERATAKNILENFQSITDRCAPRDTLIVAFAGYQTAKPQEPIGSFLATDDAVPMKSIYDMLDRCPASLELVLEDGWQKVWRKGTKVELPSNLLLAPLSHPRPKHTLFVSACAAGQRTHPHLSYPSGVFFHFVNRGLQGIADADNDNAVSTKELLKYLNDSVPAYVQKTYEYKQVPEIAFGKRIFLDREIGVASPSLLAYSEARRLNKAATAIIDKLITQTITELDEKKKANTAIAKSTSALKQLGPVHKQLAELNFAPVCLEHARAYAIRATAQRLLGEYKQAKQDLEKAKRHCQEGPRLTKNDTTFSVLYGEILTEEIRIRRLTENAFPKKLWTEALDAFEKAHKIEPFYPWIYYSRGLLHQAKDSFAKAGQDYRRTIELLIPTTPKDMKEFSPKSKLASEALWGSYIRLCESHLSLASAAKKRGATAKELLGHFQAADQVLVEAAPVFGADEQMRALQSNIERAIGVLKMRVE